MVPFKFWTGLEVCMGLFYKCFVHESTHLGYSGLVSGRGAHHTTPYTCSIKLFQCFFSHSPEVKEIGKQILSIKQGNCNVTEFAQWMECAISHKGLSTRLGLASIITLSICLDQHLCNRRGKFTVWNPAPDTSIKN